MLLVVGGAYAGKRKIIREQLGKRTAWLSSYEGDSWVHWKMRWKDGNSLVLEGWEHWIAEEMHNGKSMEEVLHTFQSLLQDLVIYEKKHNSAVGIIMLEMGRGIVPVSKEERSLRDAAGWLLQAAAARADKVLYVWHGLSKVIKGSDPS